MIRYLLIVGTFSLGFALASAPVVTAQEAKPVISPGLFTYAPQDGASLYATICQGCHMSSGQGAVGAGSYPALAKNKNLEAKSYLLHVIVNGLHGMPPFGRGRTLYGAGALSEAQIAAVANYVRTNFGNSYGDPITIDDVKAVSGDK